MAWQDGVEMTTKIGEYIVGNNEPITLSEDVGLLVTKDALELYVEGKIRERIGISSKGVVASKKKELKKALEGAGIVNAEELLTADVWSKIITAQDALPQPLAARQKEQDKTPTLPSIPADIQEEAERILREEDVLHRFLTLLGKVHVREKNILATLILSGITPSLGSKENLLHCVCVGVSGKGKSSAQDHVSLLFDDAIIVTSSSAKAVIYASKEGRIKSGSILMLDESEASDDGAAIERSVTDARAQPPTHWTIDDKKKFTEMVLMELLVMWKNRVQTQEDDQLNNRYIILNVDETETQDKIVYDHQLKGLFLGTLPQKDSREFQIARAITTKLKNESVKVLIPFTKAFERGTATVTGLANRRSFPKFVNLMKAITSLYRYQRPCYGDVVLAVREDWEVANLLWHSFVEYENSHLAKQDLELVKKLPKEREEGFRLVAFAKEVGKSTGALREKLKKLSSRGFVNSEKIEHCVFEVLDDGSKKLTSKTYPIIYWQNQALSEGYESAPKWDFIDDKTVGQEWAEMAKTALSVNKIPIIDFISLSQRIKEWLPLGNTDNAIYAQSALKLSSGRAFSVLSESAYEVPSWWSSASPYLGSCYFCKRPKVDGESPRIAPSGRQVCLSCALAGKE